MFKAQSQIHGLDHASAVMRQWFKDHEGMPRPPKPCMASGYAIYVAEETRKIIDDPDKVWKKNSTKQIKAQWNKLGDEAQEVYNKQCREGKEKFAAAQAEYEEQIEIWETKKAEENSAAGASAEVAA